MRIKYRQGEPKLEGPGGYYVHSEYDKHNVHCLRDLRYSRNNTARLLNLSHSYVSRFFYDDTHTSHTPDNHYNPCPLPPELARLKEIASRKSAIAEKVILADFRKSNGHDPEPGRAYRIPLRLSHLREGAPCGAGIHEYEISQYVGSEVPHSK